MSSNALALGALVAACGGVPVQLGIAADDTATLQRMAAAASGADLLITTGGVSVGEHDLVRSALGDQGLELDFWKIAMRPGKRLMVGRLRGTPIIGLPGNPVSTLVCGLIFVKPALERMLGLAVREGAPRMARLAVPLAANDRREDYLRAQCRPGRDGELEVEPFELQDSSMMSLLAKANCLVVRPPHAPAAAKGERVVIMPFAAGLLGNWLHEDDETAVPAQDKSAEPPQEAAAGS